MIKFLHQCQQTAKLTGRESLSRKPVQIMPRQICDDPPLVFSIGHDASNKQLQGFRIHRFIPICNIVNTPASVVQTQDEAI